MNANDHSTSRRDILRSAAAAGAASALPSLGASEPPPETKRIRLVRFSVDIACLSPMWIAEALLRAEGFDDIGYAVADLRTAAPDIAAVSDGQADMTITDIFSILPALDAGRRVVALGGIHGGCYELYGKAELRSIHDLKGKTVAVASFGRLSFVSAMLAYVGLDPRKDVTFVNSAEGVELLRDGKVDAVLGFPPDPQVMRARKIGVSVVNTAKDRPWSQYFCCMTIANRAFVAKHPVAARRALRALVKAADLCAANPEQVARNLVDGGFYKDYELSLQALRDIPYRHWREYDSADSMRFYALRLHDAGMIKSAPQTLLSQGTDWRFIEQLRRELKG